jgi:hypothetical protein
VDIGTIRAILQLKDEISGPIKNISGSLKGMASTAAAAFAALDVGASVTKLVTQASAIHDNAMKLGVSTDAYQKLKFAIEQAGGSMATLTTAFSQMSKNLEGKGGGAVGRALEDLGLEIEKLREMKPDVAFTTIAEAVAKIPDPMRQAADAQALFGRGAITLMPAIKDGIEKVGAAAPLMKEATVNAYEALGDKQNELMQKMDNLKAQALLPLIDAFLKLPDSVQNVAAGFAAFMPSVQTIALAIMGAGGPVAAFGMLSTAFTAILPFLGPAGLIAAGVFAIYEAWKHWDQIVAFLKGAFWGAVELIKKIPDALLPLLGPIGLVIVAFRKWDEIVLVAKATYEGVKLWLVDKFTQIVAWVQGKVDAVTGAFKGMYEAVVGHSYVPDMVKQIGDQFLILDETMVGKSRQQTSEVNEVFNQLMLNARSLFGPVFGGTIETMTTAWHNGRVLMKSIGQVMTGDFSGVVSGIMAGIALVRQAWLAMKDLLSHEVEHANDVRDQFEQPFASAGGLAAVLTTLGAGEGGGQLFRDWIGAKTVDDVNQSKSAIEQFLHNNNYPGFPVGSGYPKSFGNVTVAALHGREEIRNEAQVASDTRLLDAVGNLGQEIRRMTKVMAVEMRAAIQTA